MRAILAIVTMVVACGPTSSSGPIAIDDLFPQYFDAECTYLVRCREEPDTTTCLANRNPDVSELLTLVADVKAGIVIYDPDKAGEYVSALRSASCSSDDAAADSRVFAAFAGTVDVDGACESEFECKDGGGCMRSPGCDFYLACCPGTCLPAPFTGSHNGAVGAPCTSSGDCVSSLYCSDVAHTCKQPSTNAGDPCEGFDGCSRPLVCLTPPGTTGTCTVKAATGAACDPTVGPECRDITDYCDSTSLRCTPILAVGQACTAGAAPPCVSYSVCLNGTCIEDGKIGDSCGQCLAHLICASGTCAAEPDGSVCR